MDFWDAVGTVLTELTTKGDSSVDKFYSLFVKIQLMVRNQESEKEKGKLEKQPSWLSTAMPEASVPQTPYPGPSSPTLGRLQGAICRDIKAQDSNHLPGPLQSSQDPSSASMALAVRGLSLNPVSNPFSPVENPQFVPYGLLFLTLQNGPPGGHDG